MKIIKNIFLFSCFALSFGSCIDDNSTLDTDEISEINIAGDLDNMKVYNFDLGKDCHIAPDINVSNGTDDNLKYQWSIGTYINGVKGELKVVSDKKELVYSFKEGGTYYAHLAVSNGMTGKIMEYQININRTFERGYVLVSNKENGEGNLSFVKVMTPEEIESGVKQVVIENSIEKMNDGVNTKNIKNAILAKTIEMNPKTRVIISMEDKSYFLDPNTFSIISDIKYSDLYPDFKATTFMPDSYSPYAYDSKTGKYVHLNVQYMFPYESSVYKGNSFDDIYCCSYMSWMGIDTKTVFVNYEKSEVAEYDPYAVYYGTPSFPTSGDVFFGKNIITAFTGANISDLTYSVPIYVLTQSKDDKNSYSLYMKNTYAITQDKDSYDVMQFTANTESAILDRGARFVSSATFNRNYYSVDNKIYVLLLENGFTLPNKNQASISFPSNEIITYIDVNLDTEELYVATYDNNSKRGSFYIYNTADVRADKKDVNPKAVYKYCADRITKILYKPNIEN